MTRPLPDRLLADVSDDPDDYPADAAEAARVELVHLWHDLHVARQNARNGVWSMQCDNLAYRIVMLSRVAGATPWGEVGVDVLLDGLYERLHRDAGIEYPPIDWDGMRRAAAYIENGARQ